MRTVAELANQLTDDIFDRDCGNFVWDHVEEEAAEYLGDERERCAKLAEAYGNEQLARAIRIGAFVSNGPDRWWENAPDVCPEPKDMWKGIKDVFAATLTGKQHEVRWKRMRQRWEGSK